MCQPGHILANTFLVLWRVGTDFVGLCVCSDSLRIPLLLHDLFPMVCGRGITACGEPKLLPASNWIWRDTGFLLIGRNYLALAFSFLGRLYAPRFVLTPFPCG